MRSGRVWAPSDDGDVNDDAYANTQKLALVLSGLGFRLQSFEFRVSRFWGFDFSPFFASERCFQLSLADDKKLPELLGSGSSSSSSSSSSSRRRRRRCSSSSVAVWRCSSVAV